MREILQRKLPLLVLSAWCVAMLVARIWYSGGTGNAFLLWNLFLAVVPLAAAIWFEALDQRAGLRLLKGIALAVWFAFLPNAPYLATDLVHLGPLPPVPPWFDVALFGSFAATGVLLGYAAVAGVQSVLTERFGRLVGSAVAYGSLAMCGVGIYLGRFLRWNSWDLVTSPYTLANQLARELTHLRLHDATWQVSAVYGVGLILGYLTLRSVQPVLKPANPRPTSASSGRQKRYADSAP